MQHEVRVRPRRRLALSVLLIAVTLLATACSGGSKPDPEAWREQSVALSVTGFSLAGDQVQAVTWAGSGVFVAEGIAATNAHVAARAVEITGRDDRGREVKFTRILAIDMVNDLALIATDAAGSPTLATIQARPVDPKTLRQQKIFAVGNTGGLGLSTYSGEITNVIEAGKREAVMHNANIAGGASGGPVFAANESRLLGINYGSAPNLNSSMAIPAWVVQSWLDRTQHTRGWKLDEAWNLGRVSPIPVVEGSLVSRAFCVQPGQVAKVPIALTNAIDFIYSVQPTTQTVMAAGVLYGEHVVDQVAVTGQTLRAFTTPVSGYYTVVLVNPAQNTQQACAEVSAGQIDWGPVVNPR